LLGLVLKKIYTTEMISLVKWFLYFNAIL
jgi:hypothetical protein